MVALFSLGEVNLSPISVIFTPCGAREVRCLNRSISAVMLRSPSSCIVMAGVSILSILLHVVENERRL